VQNPDKEKGKGKEQEEEKQKEKEKGKGKENVPKTQQEKAKETTLVSKKRPSTTDIGTSPRKKRKTSKPTYYIVLNDNDLENIADRVCNSMSRPITTITTM
jgi:hypothetical protein